MHLVFADLHDARDPSNWSGIPFAMVRGLRQQGVNVTLASPLASPFEWPLRLVQAASCARPGLNYHRSRERLLLKSYARAVERTVRLSGADAVIAPSTLPLAFLSPEVPQFMWHDATWAGLENYYSVATGWSQRSSRSAHDADRQALRHVACAFFASSWARDSAVESYGLSSDRSQIVPFGAPAGLPKATRESAPVQVRLLSVGVDWLRKGFDDSVAVVEALRQEGLDVALDLVGALPAPGRTLPPYVVCHGRVPHGSVAFWNFFNSAHAFLLPSTAECFGLVFAEAAACGLPAIAYDTGGVSAAVQEGVTGFLVPVGDFDALLRATRMVVADDHLRRTLGAHARGRYEEVLNWDVACEQVVVGIKRRLTIG